ncbi:MAG: hypothetical protein IMX03_03075 [Brockia lithotrophica]|nr:hypothetical protein [Brockia lithotrophica]
MKRRRVWRRWIKRLRLWGVLAVVLVVVVGSMGGCASEGQSTGANRGSEYSSLKEMVRDILQTEEGKNALREALEDPEVRKSLYVQEAEAKATIRETLLSPEGAQLLQDTFHDPAFVAEYAKATAQEHAKLLKDLMKDPDYQKLVLATLKSPEFSQHLVHTLRSTDFRTVVKETANEVLEGPLFQERVAKLVKSQVEQQAKPQGQKEGDKEQKEQKEKTGSEGQGEEGEGR